MRVDLGIKDAMDLWYEHGLPPGSCTELLLRGQYEEAWYHAHMHIRPDEIWNNHIELAKSYPLECREHNYDNWVGKKNGGLLTFGRDKDEDLFNI